MVNVILNRLELLADQHTLVLSREDARHAALMAAEDERHQMVILEEEARRNGQLNFELDNLVYNMAQRCKARGVKDRNERYLWLHTLSFDQTFLDLSNGDQRDFRVREYFDPLLTACDRDKKLLLFMYANLLDRYFPISRNDRTWRPELRMIDFKPRRKSDARTKTYTIIHNWNHV